MRRREFLLGTGSLWLVGCAGTGSREWADVPWVEPALPAAQAPPRRGAAPATPGGVAPKPTPVRPGASAVGHVHVVQPGDTLASLGRRAGCSAERIADVNRLPGTTIRVGQSLWIPGAPALAADPCDACAVPSGRSPGRALASAGPGWTLVSREQWGAQCLRANHDPMQAVTRITLHHTDEHAGMRGKADADVVRAIQRYHQDQQGWADIGYHYLVGRDGRIYEGRSTAVQGAHSGGANNVQNLGVSVIGSFCDAPPPPKQLATLGAFLEDRCGAYGVERVSLLGHRDLGPTECPGGALYGWLQSFKRA